MKFKDPITGEYKTLHLKTGDTLPVGTIVSFEGDEIPEGYEEVIGEEARVVISPIEPTTGEEVWIQKGKNLYNPKNTYVVGDNSQNVGFVYKGVEVGETYTFSAPNYSWLNISIHDVSGTYIRSLDGYETIKELTFTAQENEAYIILTFYSGRENLTSTDGIDFTNVQLEQGEAATSYEPYVDKKIHTKNDNGGYEIFYEENEVLYNNPNGTQETIRLNKSITKYKYIEIFYKFGDNYKNSTKIENATNCFTTLEVQQLSNNEDYYINEYKCEIYVWENEISFERSRNLSFSTTGIKEISTTNYIKITKVVGYK